MFNKNNRTNQIVNARLTEFGYINPSDIYLDSACQSLRPTPVIEALEEYYKKFNSCGERVKYKWGHEVDNRVDAARELVIEFLELPQKDYACSFTLNTTYGLNLILSQLPSGDFKQIITSEIEHNSVFLSTIELAKRLVIPRSVLERDADGKLVYTQNDLKNAIVVVNATSNIDGRLLLNIHELINDTHKNNGIVIIDGAQTIAHHHELLVGCNADAICFSAHKLYSSSLGVVVAKKSLLKILNKTFIGGGMVSSVSSDSYDLVGEDHIHSWLEPGLQAFGEIIALKKALEWLRQVKPGGQSPSDFMAKLSKQLFDGLSTIKSLKIINKNPAPVISFYSSKIDAHRLAVFLSASGIMARSGYFCCHYYLKDKLNLPPLLRLSIGLHTTEDDIAKTIEAIKKIA